MNNNSDFRRYLRHNSRPLYAAMLGPAEASKDPWIEATFRTNINNIYSLLPIPRCQNSHWAEWKPTRIGCRSVTPRDLKHARKTGTRVWQTTQIALKADTQVTHTDQVLNWPLACASPTREYHMLGDVAQSLGLFPASVSHCFRAHSACAWKLIVPPTSNNLSKNR